MIVIDLTKPLGENTNFINGSFGGNLVEIQKEFSVIVEYVYRTMINESPKNKDIFNYIINESIKRAEDLKLENSIKKKVN